MTAVMPERPHLSPQDELALDIRAVLIRHGICCDVPDVDFLRRPDGTVRGVRVLAYDRPAEPPSTAALTEYYNRVAESGRSGLARLMQSTTEV